MKYLGYYDDIPNRRLMSPAAVNKMNYIANVIAKVTGHAEIISCSMRAKKRIEENIITLKSNVDVHYFKTRKRHKLRIVRIFDRVFDDVVLFSYLLRNVKKNEMIVVYHSLLNMRMIKLAQKFKKFKLLLEMEEIYADVIGNYRIKNEEIKYSKKAAGYIFPTQLLEKTINSECKPSIIIHGTYQVEPDRKVRLFDKEHIHCVYAGTFDPRKGGCTAAAAAEFLPSNYHMHIIGFGSDEEINNIKKLIAEISNITRARVTYDGLLSGEDYIKFIQSCDIGLSTQNPDAAFNATSFPSKVLSYLANGLRVVSICIPAVERSAVGDMLYYYNKQTPKEIADAILSVDMSSEYDSRKRIRDLDKQFICNLKNLIQ